MFRKHAHLLIAWGHKAIKSKLITTSEDDEEKITGLLAEAIEDILLADKIPWCSDYEVFNESPISGGQRLGKDRRKTDLFVKFLARKGRPKYVFEAKPQNYIKIHQRTGYYVGSEGIERFLEGEYADYTSAYPEVGMLAYVLSDSVAIWQSRLKKAIDRHQRQLRLIAPQEDVIIVDEFQYEWCSQHKRSSSDATLTIYHLLLDCVPSTASK